jgi:hypothetical protein
VLVGLGGIWSLQGLDIAFKVGPMVGDKQWVAWGVLLALVGVAQVVWSNTRQR